MKSLLGFAFCFFWVFAFAGSNKTTLIGNDDKGWLSKSTVEFIGKAGILSAPELLVDYTISGTIRFATTQQPFAGVTVTFSGLGTVTTNSAGYYEKIVPSKWTGTVTPSHTCQYYGFSPLSRSYIQVGQNYSAQDYEVSTSQNFTINGTFTNRITSLPLANFFIDFGNGFTVTTNSQGQYSLSVNPCANYTLTPTSADFFFTPTSRSYTNVSASFYNQDYLVTPKVTGLPPGWDFVNTGNVHIISVKTTANPNFCSTSLLPGDWIGVFYVGSDGLLHCGGAGMWTGTENTAVIAQGDDNYTTIKDGFSSQETMNWMVYSYSLNLQYLAYPVYETGGSLSYNNKWVPMGLSIITSLPAYKTHGITIPQGWSGISSYILPRSGTAAVTTLLAPIASKLVIMQNLTLTYWPGQSINTIVNWNSLSGYKIKVTEPVTLPIIGCDYSPKTLSLVAGWNLIPILSDCNAQVETLFATNLSKITVIKEVAGPNIYWPAMNIKTLLTLRPGKAYLIMASSAFSVTFPACSSFKDDEITDTEFINNSPWNDPVATPSNHSIALPAGISNKILMGDIIGAFTPEGICAGMVQMDNLTENKLLQVYGDDPTTPEKEGFADGDALRFKLYRTDLSQEFEVGFDYNATLPSSNGLFATDGLSAVSKIIFNPTLIGENTNNSISFYPNPGNGLVDFVAGDSQKNFRVTIFDLTGQKTGEFTFAGKVQTDLTHVPKGIYIVKIESPNFLKIEKLVIQ